MSGLELNVSACNGLDFPDGHSLAAWLRVRGVARRGGVVLAVSQGDVLRLLALTGSDKAFAVRARVAGAVVGVAGRRRRYAWRRLAVRTARPRRAALSRTGTG